MITKDPSMSPAATWKKSIQSFLLGAILITALFIYWNGHERVTHRANAVLAEAQLPPLPANADFIIFKHEGLFFGDHYLISFSAPADIIHAWIPNDVKASKDHIPVSASQEKGRLTKYAWGRHSIIIDDQQGHAYLDLCFINCSL